MNNMKINDYITYINNPDDVVYLRSKLLPVNMRLFNSSTRYKEIILCICDYINFLTLTKSDDYKLPHGMSGANAAIPFNIIGIARNRGKDNAYCEIMINPEIIANNDEVIQTKSNCGSIRLKDQINVERWGSVRVLYYDEEGNEKLKWFSSPTVQHEIDHNLGILITDKINLEDKYDI